MGGGGDKETCGKITSTSLQPLLKVEREGKEDAPKLLKLRTVLPSTYMVVYCTAEKKTLNGCFCTKA